MSTSFKNKFEELNMTQDEINRFTEAMKKEEFRKLLIEYAEEISDPKNRQLYEQEISKLEEERGMNVTFIHPEPGYCLKTTQDGNKKCFINICKNENIEKPTAKRDINNNKGGLYWQIPHSCSPAREDMEKSNKEICVVYDVVFHPDAYRMGETNQRFNQLLKDSAMDTIEKNFNVKLDKVNVKVLKSINFKGTPTASVIRKAKKTGEENQQNNSRDNDDPIEKIVDQLKTEYLENQREKPKQPIKQQTESKQETIDDKYTKPVYKIVYRGKADMQDFANQLDSNFVQSTRPKEVFISIELPLCKSSSDVILDIFEKRLYLESNSPFYKLDLNLSYPVNEKEAKAKFDKSKRCLNVTLPVIPFVDKIPINQESKIESDQLDYSSSSPESSLSSSPIEHNLKQVVQDIKYLLPTKLSLKELNDSILIQISIESYDRNSIKFNILDKSSLVLNCESISASGTYLTYYKAYLNFFSQGVKYDLTGSQTETEFTNRIKLTCLDENNFEIVLYKSSNQIESNLQVLIDSKYMDQIETNSENILVNVAKDSQDYEIKKCVKQEDAANKMHKRDYIVNFEKISKQEDSDDEDDKEDNDQKDINQLYSGSSSSSNDFENSSSLSSSMNSSMLKGILKKPRSISEGEGSLRGSFDSNSCEGSNQDLCPIKKCVSFNKQVVKNVFKPGSTITGMKKPNSNKNKKKNQKRNRTISDPSHNGDQSLMDHAVQFRLRSFSESSEDNYTMTDSNENVSVDGNCELDTQNEQKKNKKKKKKNNKKDKVEQNSSTEQDKTLTMEKMIQMKSQGAFLPSDEKQEHKTNCAFKFKNKIADDLD